MPSRSKNIMYCGSFEYWRGSRSQPDSAAEPGWVSLAGLIDPTFEIINAKNRRNYSGK
jgi:hypothetical protein